MSNFNSFLRFAWAFPATAFGLTLTLPAWVSGARISVVNGVIEVGGGCIGRAVSLLPRSLRFCAITFGHVVIGVDHTVLKECRAHERVHVRQYERWGIFFFALYVGSSIWQMLRGRHPYWDNYFERQACGSEKSPYANEGWR